MYTERKNRSVCYRWEINRRNWVIIIYVNNCSNSISLTKDEQKRNRVQKTRKQGRRDGRKLN